LTNHYIPDTIIIEKRGFMLIAKREENQTVCYTYDVRMTVQVFAENLETANEKLNGEGGYVSSRIVTLLNTNTVYESNNDDEDSTEEPSETV
jgi:hypothetical protein